MRPIVVSDFLQKPLLEVVHHNTKSLDALLDECFVALNSRFHIGEHVLCLQHDSACAVVLDVSCDVNGVCHSPSSDKENSLTTATAAAATTPASSASSATGAPSPLYYRVRLKQSDIALDRVPHTQLSRVACLPSREAIGAFIASHAQRDTKSACHPWVVSPLMLTKHALKNKIAPMFLPLSERKRAQQMQSSTNPNKKRKVSAGKAVTAKKPRRSAENGRAQSDSTGDSDECRLVACISPGSQRTLEQCTKRQKIRNSSVANGLASRSDLAHNVSDHAYNMSGSAHSPSGHAHSPSKTPSGSMCSPSSAPCPVDTSTDRIRDTAAVTTNTEKLASRTTGDSLTTGGDGCGDGGGGAGGGDEPCDSDDSDNVTLIKIAKSTSKVDELRRKAELKRERKRQRRKEQRERVRLAREQSGAAGGQSPSKIGKRSKIGDPSNTKTTATETTSTGGGDVTAAGGAGKGMRQMSLFDMGKKSRTSASKSSGGGGGGSKKASRARSSSDGAPAEKPLPPCVRKLTQLLESGHRVGPQNATLVACLRTLRAEQVARVSHEATRHLLRHRMQLADQRRQLASMSEEQRHEFLKNKRLEERRQRNMRYDDQCLPGLTALPVAQPVHLPAGLPQSAFGQLALVTEFVACHWQLLAPSSVASSASSSSATAAAPATAAFAHSVPSITTDTLMRALVAVPGAADSDTYRHFAELVTMLLRTLLKDDTCEYWSELGVRLFSLPVTPQTAAELSRLCVRHFVSADTDSDRSDDRNGVSSQCVDAPSEQLLEVLEGRELHQLSAVQRLQLLLWLVDRLLASPLLAGHQEQLEERLRQLAVQRNAIVRERRSRAPPVAADAEPQQQAPEPQSLAAAPAAEVGATGAVDEPSAGEAEMTPWSRARRTRRSVDEARAERENREKEAKEKRLQLMEQMRRDRDEQLVLDEHAAVVRQCAALVRRMALGLDRHHRRYWLLATARPFAVYVETGWAGADTVPAAAAAAAGAGPVNSVDAGHTDDHDHDEDQPLSLILQSKQSSYPVCGENRWYCYSSPEQVAALVAALADRGQRESALKDALQAALTDIEATFSAHSAEASVSTGSTCASAAEDSSTGKAADSVSATSAIKVDHADRSSSPVGDQVKKESAPVTCEGAHEQDELVKREPLQEQQEAVTAKAGNTTGVDGAGGGGDAGGGGGAEDDSLVVSLREDLLGVEQELSAGLLGGVPALCRASWQQAVASGATVAPLAAALATCFEYVAARALKPPLAPPPAHTHTADVGVTTCTNSATIANTNSTAAAAAARAESDGGEQFRCAVRQCATLSRLHVLVGVLDSCIRWELSSSQKKCRTCRRGGGGGGGSSSSGSGAGGDEAAVCAGCAHLYHWRCVRPRLYSAPDESWLCPACTPREQRTGRRCHSRPPPLSDSQLAEAESYDGDRSRTERVRSAAVAESACRVCLSTDTVAELIHCPQCAAAFHKQCHEPPVTLRLRTGWQCMDCKAMQQSLGSRRRVAKKAPLPSTLLRQARCQPDSDQKDSDEDQKDSDEDQDPDKDQDPGQEDQYDGPDEDASSLSSSGHQQRPPYSGTRALRRTRRNCQQQQQQQQKQQRGRQGKRQQGLQRQQRRSSGRTAPRNYRNMLSSADSDSEQEQDDDDDDDDDCDELDDQQQQEQEEFEDSGDEEARIRALSTDDDDDTNEDECCDGGVESAREGRQACWKISSPARQRQIRAQRRRLRTSSSPAPEMTSSADEQAVPSDDEEMEEDDL